jgi:hypothetical protein
MHDVGGRFSGRCWFGVQSGAGTEQFVFVSERRIYNATRQERHINGSDRPPTIAFEKSGAAREAKGAEQVRKLDEDKGNQIRSPSQFGREYSRLFGNPPVREISNRMA